MDRLPRLGAIARRVGRAAARLALRRHRRPADGDGRRADRRLRSARDPGGAVVADRRARAPAAGRLRARAAAANRVRRPQVRVQARAVPGLRGHPDRDRQPGAPRAPRRRGVPRRRRSERDPGARARSPGTLDRTSARAPACGGRPPAPRPWAPHGGGRSSTRWLPIGERAPATSRSAWSRYGNEATIERCVASVGLLGPAARVAVCDNHPDGETCVAASRAAAAAGLGFRGAGAARQPRVRRRVQPPRSPRRPPTGSCSSIPMPRSACGRGSTGCLPGWWGHA